MSKITEFFSIAALYKRCEKYDEMIKLGKSFILEDRNLTEQEMNIFIEGYKYKLNQIRNSLIKLINFKKKEYKKRSRFYKEIDGLIVPKSKELVILCDDFLSQIDKLISKSRDLGELITLNRHKCDYLRYKAQFMYTVTDEEKNEKLKISEEFMNIMQETEKMSKQYLPMSNAAYLELELSKCVYIYEVMDDSERAIESAKEVFNAAINECKKEKERLSKSSAKQENLGEIKEADPSQEATNLNNDKQDIKDKTNDSVNKITLDQSNENSSSKEVRSILKKSIESNNSYNVSLNSNENSKNAINSSKKSLKITAKATNKETESSELADVKDSKVKEILRRLRINIVLWSGKNEKEVKI